MLATLPHERIQASELFASDPPSSGAAQVPEQQSDKAMSSYCLPAIAERYWACAVRSKSQAAC